MSFRDYFEALWDQLPPPKTKFHAEDVPDLSGKVMLVTGANTGIGKETARILLEHNAKVYIACRSLDKAKAAVEDIKTSTGKNDIHILQMDLSDLPTVKPGVEEFLKNESRLDVLFNSAGVMLAPTDMLTAHGHDIQFGTNVLGHFHLTQLLLPTLLSTVRSSPDNHVRIVNVSSNGHWVTPTVSNGGPIVYDSLVEGPVRKKFSSGVLYGQSKAGNVLLSNALARKYGSQGIVSTSLNPGGIATDLARHTPKFLENILRVVLYPVSQGALTSLYAGTAPEALELNGKYLSPWARLSYHRADLSNEAHEEKMWEWCEAQVKKFA